MTAELARHAARIRAGALRMIRQAGSGHPGGSLSCVELLTYLYCREMKIDVARPDWEERDRFVLSKGHACPALYAALEMMGFFPEEEFSRFRQIDGILQGHPHPAIPGVDAVSGSLGMGLSQGLGMALAARHLAAPFRTYVLLGDGDMEEGSTWEALMAAGFLGIDNLVAILDSNGLQGDGPVSQQMDYGPVGDKAVQFRWHLIEIDGHDFTQIEGALDEARKTSAKPTFVLAHTTKGRGISFMEGDNGWHGSRGLTDAEFGLAMSELKEAV